MNWRSLAVHLADRIGSCILLDRDLHVRLFSLGLERLLGWARDEVEGRPFVEALVPLEEQERTRARLERALAGTLPAFETHALRRDGRVVVLALEIARVGDDAASGLLLSVTSSRSVRPPRGDDAHRDVTYEVLTNAASFGELRWMRTLTCAEPVWPAGKRCHQVLHGRESPCDDCPLAEPGPPWPRTLTRRVAGTPDVYEVVTATKEDQRAVVHVRQISGGVLTAVYEEKVRRLADTAQLSERERQVLRYLLLGRSLADVALLMKISLRTVKFHQANIIEKLGVDSRVDLIRLIV